eukprot:scaffold81056_cov48-Phaeocystis_antarctica.AAC.2
MQPELASEPECLPAISEWLPASIYGSTRTFALLPKLYVSPTHLSGLLGGPLPAHEGCDDVDVGAPAVDAGATADLLGDGPVCQQGGAEAHHLLHEEASRRRWLPPHGAVPRRVAGQQVVGQWDARNGQRQPLRRCVGRGQTARHGHAVGEAQGWATKAVRGAVAGRPAARAGGLSLHERRQLQRRVEGRRAARRGHHDLHHGRRVRGRVVQRSAARLRRAGPSQGRPLRGHVGGGQEGGRGRPLLL